MGKFKRFCMIVFVLATLMGVGVLAVLWFDWRGLSAAVVWLMNMSWFNTLEAVFLGITAVGLIVMLICAVVAPGKKSKLEVQLDRGSLGITQNAIQSSVKHVIEAHNGLKVDQIKVGIINKRDPHMTILAKIDPGRYAELGNLGVVLQKEIEATIKAFTGYPVKNVDVIFSGDANVVTPAFTQQAMRSSQDSDKAQTTANLSVPAEKKGDQ